MLNFQPIRLVFHAMKILEWILDERIPICILGFVKKSDTTDAIYAPRSVMKKRREKRLHLYILTKLFDDVFLKSPNKADLQELFLT